MATRRYSGPKRSTATANRPQSLPQFQQIASSPGNAQKYIESLDDILKKNKGGFTAIGSEASSNIPYVVTNSRGVTPGADLGARPIGSDDYYPQEPQYEQHRLPPLPENYWQQAEVPNAPQSPPSIEQFFSSLKQQYQQPPQEVENSTLAQLERSYQATGRPYPNQTLQDGSIRYRDGSVRTRAEIQANPLPVASLSQNRILYDDGVVRYGSKVDQNLTSQFQQTYGGLEGLSNFIFGKNQTVTQAYGNYNPGIEPGSGINYGTDFRTRDLTSRGLSLPVGAEVVQALYDDGTRFGDYSGHQGYGNSLLLRLPSGEMLRLSHLSSMNFQEGQFINAGDIIGTPGQTGNTYGEHLDVEYYDSQGNLADPSTFNIQRSVDLEQNLNQSRPLGEVVDPFRPTNTELYSYENDGYVSPQVQAARQGREYPPPTQAGQQSQQGEYTPITQGLTNAVQEASPLAPAADLIDRVNPTGNFDLGATELMRLDPQAAGQKLAGTIERQNPTGDFDTGISEALRGDFGQARENFADASSRVANRVGAIPGQLANQIVPQAFASDGSNNLQQVKQTLGENIGQIKDRVGSEIDQQKSRASKIFSDATSKPMEGLAGLKDDFQGAATKAAGGVFGSLLGSAGRKVGEIGGQGTGNQATTQLAQSSEKNDIRDPFFKLGGQEMFKDMINPAAIGEGGLSLGLFNDKFYQNPDNIANVFGATYLAGKATDKFRDFQRSVYPKMSRMGYSDEYERSSIDDYNRQIDDYNNQLEGYFNSIKDFVTPNRTFADAPQRTSMFTPGTNPSGLMDRVESFARPAMGMFSGALKSVAPQMRALSAPTARAISAPSFRPGTPSPSMGSAPSMSPSANLRQPARSPVIPAMSPQTKAAVASLNNKPLPKPTYAPPVQKAIVAAAPPKVAGSSAKVAQQSKPSSGIFTKAVGFVNKIFRR